ncbi:MAG TPA: CoA-acylating methylmalonate-semialdehyde dehydrogenase [Candidatus Limnocylindrales bacterium]|nr:CoA-acylating methylmalonate-semialdehyde dehydrogenase [Candidatus Limnocylindrales bacterium]
MGTQVTHFVNGKSWEGSAHETSRKGELFDPLTGEVRAMVDFASTSDVGAIVDAAAEAWTSWRDTSLAKRTAIMFAFRDLLFQRRDELAAVVSAEHGKVHSDAMGEVQRALEVVEYACGIPSLLKGGYSENVSTEIDSYSIRQPLGVVAVITPFNFPAMVPMWFVPLAIACGNTVVLKPSEKDPSAANLLASWFIEAGLPEGVFNVAHGDKEAVDALLTHPTVKAVSFVGSTPIARYIYETGTAHGKRVQALGGAKNHMVVLPDADLDLAADAAVGAGFGSAGERCMAISVVVAVDPIGEDLVSRIASRVREIELGTDMGPLVTGAHRDRVASYVDAGAQAGAKVVVDGRDQLERPGFWFGPTLFDHVTPDMTIYTDEIFGPVLCVARAGSYDEALALVNGTNYGNGTAIFTNDGGAARRFQHEVEVGMVGVNVPIPVPMAYYSFGGWASSLFGDSHAYGADGVHFFTRGKVVTSRWLNPSHGGVNLGFPTNT